MLRPLEQAILDRRPRRSVGPIQPSLPQRGTKNLIEPRGYLIIRYFLFAKETENSRVKGRQMPVPTVEFDLAAHGMFRPEVPENSKC
jgi:hypothetical protein